MPATQVKRRFFLVLAIVLAIFAAYWKLEFPNQFSLLTGYESANQAYAWNHFFASTIQRGELPLWDPYGQAGRPLAAEMQSGLFYPPKIVLYLWPFNASGHLSPRLYHWFYLVTAMAGAWFMFLLAREVGLSDFAAYFAAVVFTIGGFTGRIVWPHLHDGAIWLPLALCCIFRALRRTEWTLYACAAGLAMGMTVLAGALHLVIMQAMAIAALAAYFAARKECPPSRAVAILATTAVICAAAGAVQLLPSIEYSARAFRFLGESGTLPANERIPYGFLGNNFSPRALWGLLSAYPFAGDSIGTYETSPYIGILPLVAAILGIWRNWATAWVRYLTALAALAFLYTLGNFYPLHGILYAITPRLWMAREPGRFIYLMHFALALLAGFGVQSLLDSANAREIFRQPIKILGIATAVVAAVLTIPALTNVQAPEWSYLAFLQLLLAFAWLLTATRGALQQPALKILLIALTIGDLASTNFTIRDTRTMPPAENHLQILFDSEPLAMFLKTHVGDSRVMFLGDWAPSLGEVYGVRSTSGMAATSLRDYQMFMLQTPHALEMMGVKYFIRPASSAEPGAVYSDRLWKVYETGKEVFPRAWLADDASHRVAADIRWTKSDADRLDLTLNASVSGLLVMSEVYDSGWRAIVNGRATPVREVAGVFRGVAVARGENRIEMVYRPLSVYAGAGITLLCFAAVLAWFVARTVRRAVS